MNFTTLTFLLFLVVVFTLYWTIRQRFSQNVLLIISSYLFYAWWDWRFCALMIFSSMLDYLVGWRLGIDEGRWRRRLLLGISLAGNLGLLGFFKYYNFFMDSLTRMLSTAGLSFSVPVLQLVLPVGISFYTFQTLSYTIDVYRRRFKPCLDVVSFFAFVSFFPQLVAGPVERASHLLPQMYTPRQFDYSLASDGSKQILWGFFKKIVLADNLGLIVAPVYADLPAATGGQVAVATFAFAFQVYCDFSAYSDIAIGTARLFGFGLVRNFNYPYFAASLSEFWQRWHISLSRWFQDYVFIPLGGSRESPWTTVRNLLLTFLASGLWHGASWTFILWGFFHGVGVSAQAIISWGGERPMKQPEDFRLASKAIRLAKIAGTFMLVCLGWIFFRAPSVSDALNGAEKLFSDIWSTQVWQMAFQPFNSETISPWVLGGFIAFEAVQRRRHHPLQISRHWPRPLRWALYTTLVIMMFIYGAGPSETSDFIYFQF